jgi:hypothetical protein
MPFIEYIWAVAVWYYVLFGFLYMLDYAHDILTN